MKPGNLLWLAFAGVMFLAFAPHIVADEHSAAASTEAGAAPAQAKALDWYAGETVLDRQSDGHFYADANVEGVPVHFLVDTGASMIALTAEDATDAGLTWNDDDLRVVARGASGQILGVPATLNEVSLGGFSTRGVPAIIIPQGLPVSLLGQSFLSRLGKMDVVGDKMTLGDTQ
jgi:aspartyl protease family protein